LTTPIWDTGYLMQNGVLANKSWRVCNSI